MDSCCLPVSPCGDVGCQPAPNGAVELCSGLAEENFQRFREQSWHCAAEEPTDGPAPLPTWSDAAYLFFWVPLVAALITTVLWVVLRLLYDRTAGSAMHRNMVTHIGSFDHPHPRKTTFMIWMNRLQILISLLMVALFVFDTYARTVHPFPARCAEGLLGLFLVFHSLVQGIRSEFKIEFLLTTGQLVDYFTVPYMLLAPFLYVTGGDQWLSLRFLRSIQALLAYEQLEALGAFGHVNTNEYRQVVVQMALKSLCFVICVASLVLMFEVLGDPVDTSSASIDTGMGVVDFYKLTYWIFETMSTVGFGDFAPTTVLSRSVMIGCMLSGVTVFTWEIGKIMNFIDQERKGAGSYKKKASDHVILMGGGAQHMDENFLIAFLEELYHSSYRTYWPDLVVMSGGPESVTKAQDTFNHTLERDARQRVTYIDGSPLNVKDLKRCQCGLAKLVFVIADTTGSVDPLEEDKENILRALSVSVRYPETPVMLMLLAHESKGMALSVGIQPQRCFSLNELKNSMFWQSCRCMGFNTLLSNLMVTTEAALTEEEKANAPWMENYVSGMGHEIYGLLVSSDEFIGKPFTFLVQKAYQAKGICIFAAQLDGVIVLAPLRRLQKVRPDIVFFALAEDELKLHGIAHVSTKVLWKEEFLSNQFDMFQRLSCAEMDAAQKEKRLESVLLAAKEASWPASLEEQRTEKPIYRRLSMEDNVSDASSNPAASPTVSPRRIDSQRSVYSSSVEGSEGLSPKSPRLTPRRQATTKITARRGRDSLNRELGQQLEERAQRIRKRAATCPFILVLEFAGSWEQVMSFLSQRHASYLPFRIPIVVLCPTMLSKAIAKELLLDEDEHLAVIWGSANSKKDLIRSGVGECSIVIGLGQSMGTAFSELAAMLDSDVVTLYRVLVGLSGRNCDMIFEFKRTQSMRLLPQLSAKDSVKELDAVVHSARRRLEADGKVQVPGRTELEIAFLDPRFASGRVFAPRVLGSLLAHEFHTPGIVEVMQALVMPSDELPTFLDDAEEEEEAPGNMSWQLQVRPEFWGIKYGEVMNTLMHDPMHPSLPLGIYRSFNGKSVAGNNGYVWTNPPNDTIIKQTDRIFVLGEPSFGQLAHASDLLPHGPAGLTNLLACRAAHLRSR